MGKKINNYDLDEESRLELEHEKRGFFAYISIVFQKFIPLMNLNFLFLAFSLPYIFLLFWISPLTVETLSGISENAAALVAGLGAREVMTADIILRFLFAVSITLLWGSGPASAGIAYVLRNYSRREHAWVWADYIASIRENFWQSVLVLFVDILAIFLISGAFRFYSTMFAGSMQIVMLIALTVFTLIFTFMHFYIYQLMVTYEDSFLTILKNALMFAMLKSVPNLFLFVFNFGITAALFYFIQLFALVPYVVVLTILLALTIHFYASRTIARTLETDGE